MRITIHEGSFEDKISMKGTELKYKIIYPRVEYPIPTEAEGRLNDELFCLALAKRSYIRNLAQDMKNTAKGRKEFITGYTSEIRTTYVDGMFVSFLCESILTTNTAKNDITYSAKTYRISSARLITLEKLFRHQQIKPILWEKLTENTDTVLTKATYEDFLMYYKNTDFFLTSDGITLFFPPDSIIGGYDMNIHVTIPYGELKGALKYQFA